MARVAYLVSEADYGTWSPLYLFDSFEEAEQWVLDQGWIRQFDGIYAWGHKRRKPRIEGGIRDDMGALRLHITEVSYATTR